MRTDHSKQRISYVFLCATPFVSIAGVVRPLRIPGVYHVIGVVLFAAISIAAWTLGARTIRADVQGRRLLGLAGILLVTPFALVALFWVGLGGPWAATPAENQMRYLVLIVMASAVAGGFVVLKEVLGEAGERFYSTLGFAAIILAGPLYLIWDAFVFNTSGDRLAPSISGSPSLPGGRSDLCRDGGVCGFSRPDQMVGPQGGPCLHHRELHRVILHRDQCPTASGPGGGLPALVHHSRFYSRDPGPSLDYAVFVGRRFAAACGR